MKTRYNTFGAACYDQNSIEELIECINNYQNFGNAAVDKTDCEEWNITPQEWIQQIKDAFYDKITDLVEKAKKIAFKYGRFEFVPNVYLITGKNVIEKTLNTDEVAEGYTVDDIQEDGLYIQANNGYFSFVEDDDIRKIIASNL